MDTNTPTPPGTRIIGRGGNGRTGVVIDHPYGEKEAPLGLVWVQWDYLYGDQFDYHVNMECDGDFDIVNEDGSLTADPFGEKHRVYDEN